jgi:hypothetical protein
LLPSDVFEQISSVSCCNSNDNDISKAAATPHSTLEMPATSDAHHIRRYHLNSANYRAPLCADEKKVHRAKSRDIHLSAVHNLADVLGLNPALAAAAAAMRLPNRTKVS